MRQDAKHRRFQPVATGMNALARTVGRSFGGAVVVSILAGSFVRVHRGRRTTVGRL